jgi:chlorite dismutase
MATDQENLIDISEKGRTGDGRSLSTDRRLFMQLLAYSHCADVTPLVSALSEAHVDGVLYQDINDPQGIALLTMSESPDYLVTHLRQILNQPPFRELEFKPEYTMLGRTYTLGHEPDLQAALIDRPRQRVLDPNLAWAIWYPLRRSGTFEQLSADEQRTILMEHGGVGRSYGRAGYAYDIRLACYGLDKHDNDFVIGLLGPELYPLSSVVQRMRKTRQTSLYLEQLGPFFVGQAIWQSEV